MHPSFSTKISPVGSVVALPCDLCLIFDLCLLLPLLLVNNHVRLLFMRRAMHDAVTLDMQSCAFWHAGLCSTQAAVTGTGDGGGCHKKRAAVTGTMP